MNQVFQITFLSCFQFHEAIKSLESVKKSVEEGAHYGEYVIYKYERQVLIHTNSSSHSLFLLL